MLVSTQTQVLASASGVGSNSCGPELLEKYRLAEKEIEFGFSINGSKSIVGVEFHPIILNKKFQKTTCISYYTVLF